MSWVPHDIRDAVVDFIRRWAKRTGIAVTHFISWLGISPSKFYDWRKRYGKANEHNALIPRDFWLEEWEKQAIIDFHLHYPLEGYRCRGQPRVFFTISLVVVAAYPLSANSSMAAFRSVSRRDMT